MVAFTLIQTNCNCTFHFNETRSAKCEHTLSLHDFCLVDSKTNKKALSLVRWVIAQSLWPFATFLFIYREEKREQKRIMLELNLRLLCAHLNALTTRTQLLKIKRKVISLLLRLCFFFKFPIMLCHSSTLKMASTCSTRAAVITFYIPTICRILVGLIYEWQHMTVVWAEVCGCPSLNLLIPQREECGPPILDL